MNRLTCLLFGICVNLGCVPASPPAAPRIEAGWPVGWSNHLGHVVTVEGVAAEQKLGPVVTNGERSIFIDGRDQWPAGYYHGGESGRRVRVTGTVIARDDVPVFVPRPDGLCPQGVPVAPEEMETARRRYLLKDATWILLDEI